MSTIVQKYSRLLEKLQVVTSYGRVEWKIDDFSEEVSAIVGARRLGFKIVTKAGNSAVKVTVYDENGKSVDSFDDDDFSTSYPPTGYASYWLFMNDIMTAGRRSATGADKIIDSLIDELDDEVPF